jgi:hypothetical protein
MMGEEKVKNNKIKGQGEKRKKTRRNRKYGNSCGSIFKRRYGVRLL